MPKQNDLFDLIHSLSKVEKRHFKLTVSNTGKNSNYLQLFDAIAQQGVYDEKEIKSKFAGKAFVKQLHVTKSYLYQLILKTLRDFDSSTSIDAQIREMLQNIEFLYKKELTEQCLPLLKKALNLATEYEKQIQLLDLLTWQRKLYMATQTSLQAASEINNTLLQEKETLERITNINHYWHYSINIFNNNASVNDDFLADDYIRDDKKARTFHAKILYYHVHFANATIGREPESALHWCEKLITLFEHHPHQVKIDPNAYITAISNKVSMLLQLKHHDTIPPLLDKIKKIPETYGLKTYSSITIKQLLRTYNIELELYRDMGQAEKGIALINGIEKFLSDNKTNVSREYYILFYYQFAYLYFLDNNYSSSLHWLNNIVKERFGDLRPDIQTHARLLTLIVHFELGNTSLLKYAVDACRRFIKKKRTLAEYEITLLNLFSQLSMAHEHQFSALFEKSYIILFNGDSAKMSREALDYLDVKSWMQRKLAREFA